LLQIGPAHAAAANEPEDNPLVGAAGLREKAGTEGQTEADPTGNSAALSKELASRLHSSGNGPSKTGSQPNPPM